MCENQIMLDVKNKLDDLVDMTFADCLNEQMKSLRKRDTQLVDVKMSIRILNEQIRNDLLNVLEEQTAHLRLKIDNITHKIKEQLQVAYKAVKNTEKSITGILTFLSTIYYSLKIL